MTRDRLDLLRRLYRHAKATGFGQDSEASRREFEDLFSTLAASLKRENAVGSGSTGELILHTDGGSRGNPGPAGAGGVLLDAEGGRVEDFALPLGVATNNEAEYHALIEGLKRAKARRPSRLVVRADSLLVIQQMRGAWRIKDRKLVKLHLEARRHLPSCPVVFEHVPREKNVEADRLANLAMDQQAGSEGSESA
ncbi:MAG: ribonuclease HI family protein [Acidobacteriota bacterium]